MVANTAAEALSQFLSSSPEAAPAGGELIDRLGQVLFSAGDGGLSIADAMAGAGLTRPEFLTILSTVTSTGLVETFADAGQQKLRLTPVGKSLY